MHMARSTYYFELSRNDAVAERNQEMLEEIKSDDEAYIEANRILKFLQYFIELEDTSDIPSTSILREFIGGSKIVD